MRSVYTRLIVTVLISTSLGVGATAIVASSENGYVAGFVDVPLLVWIGLTSLILIVAGLITFSVKGKYGPWLLLAAVLIPGSFLFSAITAKEFELSGIKVTVHVMGGQGSRNVIMGGAAAIGHGFDLDDARCV